MTHPAAPVLFKITQPLNVQQWIQGVSVGPVSQFHGDHGSHGQCPRLTIKADASQYPRGSSVSFLSDQAPAIAEVEDHGGGLHRITSNIN